MLVYDYCKDLHCPTHPPWIAIRGPLWLRRALHDQNPMAGAIRKRHGGPATPWGVRKGDFVEATKAGSIVQGYVSGYTETAKTRNIAVVDTRWKRLGQFTVSQVRLLRRTTRMVVSAVPNANCSR